MRTETIERLCKVYEHGWRLFLVDDIAVDFVILSFALSRMPHARLLACLHERCGKEIQLSKRITAAEYGLPGGQWRV